MVRLPERLFDGANDPDDPIGPESKSSGGMAGWSIEDEAPEDVPSRLSLSMRGKVLSCCAAYLLGMLLLGAGSSPGLAGVFEAMGQQPANMVSPGSSSPDDLYLLSNATYAYGKGYTNLLAATPDGGYLMADNRYIVVKIDTDGRVEWNRTFGGLVDHCLELSDGGYVMAGAYRPSPSIQWDLYVFRIDSQGDLIWERRLKTESPGWKSNPDMWNDGPGAILPAEDGYIIVGEVSDVVYERGARFAMKLDEEGNLVWDRGLEDGGGTDGLAKRGGGYVLVGSARAEEYDKDFNLVSSRPLARVYLDLESVIEVDDGYVTVGRGPWGGGQNDIYVCKLDYDLDTVWSACFGDPEAHDWGHGILATDDGYVVVGECNWETGLIYGLDRDGEKLWQVNTTSRLLHIVESPQGGFTVAGWDMALLSYYEGDTPPEPVPDFGIIQAAPVAAAIILGAIVISVIALSRRDPVW